MGIFERFKTIKFEIFPKIIKIVTSALKWKKFGSKEDSIVHLRDPNRIVFEF